MKSRFLRTQSNPRFRKYRLKNYDTFDTEYINSQYSQYLESSQNKYNLYNKRNQDSIVLLQSSHNNIHIENSDRNDPFQSFDYRNRNNQSGLFDSANISSTYNDVYTDKVKETSRYGSDGTDELGNTKMSNWVLKGRSRYKKVTRMIKNKENLKKKW